MTRPHDEWLDGMTQTPRTAPLDDWAAHYLTGERHYSQDFENGTLARITPRRRLWPFLLPIVLLAGAALAWAAWSLPADWRK